jgi:hypothetical protein
LAASGYISIWPAERAQKDFLRFASAGPGLSPVTAVLSFDPGFARRYAATPFSVMPAPDLVGLKFPDLTEVLMPMPRDLGIYCAAPP